MVCGYTNDMVTHFRKTQLHFRDNFHGPIAVELILQYCGLPHFGHRRIREFLLHDAATL